jgi:hypothetical protein
VTEAIDDLVRLLDDPKGPVRKEAVHALGALRAKERVPELVRRLGDRDGDVREQAILTLQALGASEALPDVEKLLADPRSDVRAAAAAWLCESGSRKGGRALVEGMISLSLLNAVRAPELWRKLNRERVTGPLNESRIKTLRELARRAGLELDLPPAMAGEEGMDLPMELENREGMSLREALEQAMPGPFVLEPDRIRVLTRGEAADFWESWLAP